MSELSQLTKAKLKRITLNVKLNNLIIGGEVPDENAELYDATAIELRNISYEIGVLETWRAVNK